MAEIWPKTLKNAQNLKNGLGLCAHRAVVYDHVFWLEVDSEPAGRDLFADLNFGAVGQRCLKQNFSKRENQRKKKRVFLRFLGKRLTDFHKIFFL